MDTSSAIDTHRMFQKATNFNQDISNWDVSNVLGMDYMFDVATSLNQDLSNGCVTNIFKEPEGFSTSSALIEANKPVWTTCPSD